MFHTTWSLGACWLQHLLCPHLRRELLCWVYSVIFTTLAFSLHAVFRIQAQQRHRPLGPFHCVQNSLSFHSMRMKWPSGCLEACQHLLCHFLTHLLEVLCLLLKEKTRKGHGQCQGVLVVEHQRDGGGPL